MIYTNNSVFPITEMGETTTTSNNGLQCITDRRPCCQTTPNRAGEWYFPDEMGAVPTVGSATLFYRNRGDDGTVNLNRINAAIMSPTGQFCCVVPDTADVIQTVCVNIGIIQFVCTCVGLKMCIISGMRKLIENN